LANYRNSFPEVISNQKLNDYLKEPGKFAGIDQPVQKVKFIGSRPVEETVPKIELITTHTVRRTFVTLSLEKGIRPETVLKITGQKNSKTLMKYVQVTDDIIDLEMGKWDSFSLPVPSMEQLYKLRKDKLVVYSPVFFTASYEVEKTLTI
jgi:hypothetical protein